MSNLTKEEFIELSRVNENARCRVIEKGHDGEECQYCKIRNQLYKSEWHLCNRHYPEGLDIWPDENKCPMC